MKARHTTLARVPRILLRYAEERGFDRAELLSSAGLTEQELGDPDRRVPLDLALSLWRVVLSRTEDPLFCLEFGGAVRIREYGLVGYTMLHSRTLGCALDRLVRYVRILDDSIRFSKNTAGDRVELVIHEPLPLVAELPRIVDADLAASLTIAREVTGTELIPAKILIPTPEPAVRIRYETFFRCRPVFGASRAAILFDRRQMDLPVVATDNTLCGYLDTMADQELEALAGSSYTEKVQRVIWQLLSEGRPTVKSAASALAVSTRTLQRRLREEGVVYGTHVDKLRRRKSAALQKRRDLPVYQIAYLLGYSEPSTFHRAFRRWYSMTPAEFRE
jgi:AraC-like DNA-binding protein